MYSASLHMVCTNSANLHMVCTTTTTTTNSASLHMAANTTGSLHMVCTASLHMVDILMVQWRSTLNMWYVSSTSLSTTSEGAIACICTRNRWSVAGMYFVFYGCNMAVFNGCILMQYSILIHEYITKLYFATGICRVPMQGIAARALFDHPLNVARIQAALLRPCGAFGADSVRHCLGLVHACCV